MLNWIEIFFFFSGVSQFLYERKLIYHALLGFKSSFFYVYKKQNIS